MFNARCLLTNSNYYYYYYVSHMHNIRTNKNLHLHHWHTSTRCEKEKSLIGNIDKGNPVKDEDMRLHWRSTKRKGGCGERVITVQCIKKRRERFWPKTESNEQESGEELRQLNFFQSKTLSCVVKLSTK